MLKSLEIKTSARSEMLDITDKIKKVISESKVKSGLCTIYIPHTTAGITINENADPSVRRDILDFLEKNIPPGNFYKHTEGNADSHIKATLVGSSVNVLIEDGDLVLGTWQGIFFCEFDGPRRRKVFMSICENSKS